MLCLHSLTLPADIIVQGRVCAGFGATRRTISYLSPSLEIDDIKHCSFGAYQGLVALLQPHFLDISTLLSLLKLLKSTYQGPLDTFCVFILEPNEIDYYHSKGAIRILFRT